MQIDVLSQVWSEVGEGPIWNEAKRTITWVDITGKKWHRLAIDSGSVETHSVPTMLGAAVETNNGE